MVYLDGKGLLHEGWFPARARQACPVRRARRVVLEESSARGTVAGVDPVTIAAIATGVAVLSFLLSGFVYLRQRRTESRAHFTAEWENHERPVFINHGPGAAQNVEAELAGNMRPALPLIPYIGPFQATPMEVSQRHSGPEIDALTITWTDNQSKDSVPDLYRRLATHSAFVEPHETP